MARSVTELGVVLYPGVQQAAVLGITDLLQTAHDLAQKVGEDAGLLRMTHWSLEGSEGPKRVFDTLPDNTECPSVLILPPSLQPLENIRPEPGLIHWLKARHETGAVLTSVCAGAFVLARTGLLNGRTATTHWMYRDDLAKCYPDIRLDTDRLIIDDGDIITAGGSMAWTDLGLRLVDRYLGPRVMIDTARLLLIDPPGREQRFYSGFSPRLTHGDAAILKAQHWLHANDARESSVVVLADKAGLEERTFLRRFQRATGMTSNDYAQRVRVNKARELLQFGRDPIESVAWKVGYRDPGAFRKVFTRIVGLGPGDYRKRFGASNQ